MKLKEFLESSPPCVSEKVEIETLSGNPTKFRVPPIHSHCDHEHCGRLQIFDPETAICLRLKFSSDGIESRDFKYTCRNCKTTLRWIWVCGFEKDNEFHLMKVGEFPPFGPVVPTSVHKLLGPDAPTFFNGRRCESQGLGIGAFAYYRRVVENQKNRLLDEIIGVAQSEGADSKTIALLEKAKIETQFSKAVDDVKDAIPELLRIGGHNPLKLLHRALSSGLHEESDEACLTYAHDIRIVLTELSRRIQDARKERQELAAAVSRLLRPRDGGQ